MRKPKDRWTQTENEIIDDYVIKNNSKSSQRIAEIIANESPKGLKPIRYEGGSLVQHISERKRILK